MSPNARRLLLCAVMLAGCTARQPIIQVRVSNENHQLMRLITDPNDLLTFARNWDRMTEADPTSEPHWSYWIDVARSNDSMRWAYNPDGWSWPVRIKGGAIYRVPDFEQVNALIGVPKSER